MPIYINGTEITANKINGNNVTEENLNGVKVWPTTPATTYTVRFYAWNGGSLLKTETVPKGGNATAPTTPTRTGYTWNGWDKSFTNVQSNLNIYGTWTIKTYTVRFYAWDGGSLLKTQTVNHGNSATPPADPTRSGYTFTGWSPPYNNVTSNLNVYGQWQQTSSNNYYVFIDIGDYNFAEAGYLPEFPNAPYTSQPAIDNLWTISILNASDPGEYFTNSSDLHTEYPFTQPGLYTPGRFVAFYMEDLNHLISSDDYFYMIFEVESA